MKHLNKDIGNYGEKIAQNFLKKNGYHILDCNFRTHIGELDVICRKQNLLIIVEVKSRYNLDYGFPRESVNYQKQKSIIKLTYSYIYLKKLYNLNIRFDIIEILFNNNNSKYEITHIKDAFRL
ncbi:MAG: YraN family protein [Clostridium sp.]